MSVTVNGQVLLNPAEKGEKFAKELKNGFRFTNDGKVKKNESGKPIRLTKRQSAFRSGYLTARKDNAKCFNAKKKKK